LIYEFFGSLLTGILVSIGAPYWHGVLQALFLTAVYWVYDQGEGMSEKPGGPLGAKLK